MDTFRTSSARTPREAPRVGEFRRGSRVRTTKAGTWFPALSATDEPAGLLLLHPAVKPAVLQAAIRRLAVLRLPGVLPMLPDLVDQAGRNWLVATVAPNPTVADLLDDTAYGTPENAAALLADIAATLLDVHAEGMAHGGGGAHAVVLGPDGEPMLADWGLDDHASVDGDTSAWCELAELLARRWCADSPTDAAMLARAVNATTRPGPDGGLAGALAVLSQPDQTVPERGTSVPLPGLDEPRPPAPPQPAPTEPAPTTRTPARVAPADLAPPEAQRYISAPIESLPPEASPPRPAPNPAPTPKPAPGAASQPRPSPRPPAQPTPTPISRPVPPRVSTSPESIPVPSPNLAPEEKPGSLTTPLPRMPAGPPAPAAPRSEPPRSEAPRSEAPRSEAPRSEAPRSEEPPHDGPRHAASPAPDEHDPLPPVSEAGTAPGDRSRSKLGRPIPALLTALLTVILVGAVAMIIRPFDKEEPPPPERSAPLEIRDVSVAAQMNQSICMLIGNVTTNGQPGRLVYRWVGENGSQAVSSVSTAGYNYQVEVGLLWSPNSPPLHGSSVTLQILEPRPSTTSVVVPIGCI